MLVDTNVLVAAAVPTHPHHGQSSAFLVGSGGLSVAVHSLAEFVSTVTRPGLFGWSGEAAARQIQLFGSAMSLLALDKEQMLRSVRRFALDNRRGPLIYDWLMGEHAVAHQIPTIVTWNVKHMAPLFPQLRVVTPTEI